MTHLDQLEQESLLVLREARRRWPRLALLWSVGKDSTALLWLCRKAFLGAVPFPVLHLDTGCKFPEIYAMRDALARAWGLDLRVWRNEAAHATAPRQPTARACCTARKTDALRQAVAALGAQALLVGIRRDEHGVRAKERYWSPRGSDRRSAGVPPATGVWPVGEQPPELGWCCLAAPGAGHVRVHPLLHFTERDVWRYTQREGLPVNPLYFARAGQRYRSIGCAPCCQPIVATATTVPEILAELADTPAGERAGRAQDKEAADAMQQLRALGYL